MVAGAIAALAWDACPLGRVVHHAITVVVDPVAALDTGAGKGIAALHQAVYADLSLVGAGALAAAQHAESLVDLAIAVGVHSRETVEVIVFGTFCPVFTGKTNSAGIGIGLFGIETAAGVGIVIRENAV